MDVSNYWWQSQQGDGPGGIGNSLRFRGAQQLTRTNGAPTNNTVTTTSFWFKKATLNGGSASDNVGQPIRFGVFPNLSYIDFSTGGVGYADNINVLNFASAVNGFTHTTAVFRDPSAWYHFVLHMNGSDVRWYVNGQLQNVTQSGNNGNGGMFNSNGSVLAVGNALQGYLADYHFIDGQSLEPTDFGEFDANDVWIPSDVDIADYGTNGFYLDFSDPADIGADRSGNGNNFTPTGFELADQTSPNWDHMEDSPTQNFATLDPLDCNQPSNLKDANLTHFDNTSIGGFLGVPATHRVYSGKFYWEVTMTKVGTVPNTATGITFNLVLGRSTNGGVGTETGEASYHPDGSIKVEGTPEQNVSTYGNGDVIGVAINCDASPPTITFFKNGTQEGIPVEFWGVEKGWTPMLGMVDAYGSSNSFNAGQRPFIYTPPAGFEPLQTHNFSAAPIPNGRDHFQAITDTGANILTSAQTAFPNGLWWIKSRVTDGNTGQHQFVDSSRPDNSALLCPQRVATPSAYVAPAGNSVAWCWSCPDTFTPGQTGGITVNFARRNVDAGFAMMDLSHPNISGNTTIEHGLGRPVDFTIGKSLQATSTWSVYHRSAGAGGRLRMDTNTEFQVNSGFYDDTDPDENVITFGPVFNGGDRQMLYAWASVPGYSAFGSYESNNSADGPFCYLGFRPAFLMVKNIDLAQDVGGEPATGSWMIVDSTRDVDNPTTQYFRANFAGPEYNARGSHIDILSNGFKLRASYGEINGGTNTYIYCAFAENPMGGSNVSPANAR